MILGMVELKPDDKDIVPKQLVGQIKSDQLSNTGFIEEDDDGHRR